MWAFDMENMLELRVLHSILWMLKEQTHQKILLV